MAGDAPYDENLIPPLKGVVGGCLCHEPDRTFQQETPAAQGPLPVKGRFQGSQLWTWGAVDERTSPRGARLPHS